jgi:pimeloyl-ACP methyl ester carboxylesterase
MPPGVKFASTNEGDIAYVERGEGPPALFVHGVFLSSHLWRHVVEGVADVRRCIAVDLLAHGATSIGADQDVSFDAQARMLEGVCLALELEQVDLVGNDSGGGIAQIFAARHPDIIRTLTLTNSDVHDNWPPPALGPLMRAVAQGRLADIGRGLMADVGFARRFFGPGLEHPERISPETFHTYLAPLFATPEATGNLERFFAAVDCLQTVVVEPLLKRLTAPTLVVWGTDDIFFPLPWARETIPGCGKVIELEGARLFFPEERPEVLAAALREHWQASQA